MSLALLLGGLVSGSHAAFAKSWVIDPARSSLGFEGRQGDKTFTGSFRRFTVTTDFDPQKPEGSKVEAVIDIGSITAGDPSRDAWLPQKDWFDAKTFPEARYVSTAMRKTADGFQAEGNLTIKGVTRPVPLSFTFVPEGDSAHVVGVAHLMRTDFKIGEGSWANENYVKFAVDVTFDLWAKAGN